MKKIASGFVSFSLLCILSAGSLAEHKGWSEDVTLKNSVLVVDRVIKPGKYLVSYDPKTSEMSFRSNGNLIVKTTAGIRIVKDKFKHDTLLTTPTDEGLLLMGIGLGGQNVEIGIYEISSSGE